MTSLEMDLAAPNLCLYTQFLRYVSPDKGNFSTKRWETIHQQIYQQKWIAKFWCTLPTLHIYIIYINIYARYSRYKVDILFHPYSLDNVILQYWKWYLVCLLIRWQDRNLQKDAIKRTRLMYSWHPRIHGTSHPNMNSLLLHGEHSICMIHTHFLWYKWPSAPLFTLFSSLTILGNPSLNDEWNINTIWAHTSFSMQHWLSVQPAPFCM